MSPSALSEPLRTFFQGICHQQPERTFGPGDTLLPLCARCTGIWEAALLALLALLLIPGVRSKRPGRILTAAAFVTLVVFGVEIAQASATGVGVPNMWRYLVGAGGGFSIGVAVLYLNKLLEGERSVPSTRDQLLALGAFAVALVVAWLTIMAESPAAWYLHALLTTAGILGGLTAINYVLLAAVFSVAKRSLSMWVQLATAAVVAVGEIAALGFLAR
jgi:uncharacterized membrane protein